MPALPLMLQVQGRRCVIVGGGTVAVRRAQSLLACGAQVVVVAPAPDPLLDGLDLTLCRRPYAPGDLAGAVLVVTATDDPAVNRAAADEAQRAGALVNRADDPTAGDVAIPAHVHDGPVTLAVHTDGVSARAAATIRDQLHAAMDRDWPKLLALAAPHRARIQARFADDPAARRAALARLTDPQAMQILKTQGPAALTQHYAPPGSPRKPPEASGSFPRATGVTGKHPPSPSPPPEV